MIQRIFFTPALIVTFALSLSASGADTAPPLETVIPQFHHALPDLSGKSIKVVIID